MLERDTKKEKSKNINLKCCYGISSQASEFNNDHTLFLDYDNINENDVIHHIEYIQDYYDLSDAYIIGSRNGFNAVFLDILPLYLCFKILSDVVSPVDRDFAIYGFNRGYYTLRFDQKEKKFDQVIKSNNNYYDKSLAHKLFLEWFFKIKIPDHIKFGSYEKVNLIQYPSEKDGYHLVNKKLPSFFGAILNDE